MTCCSSPGPRISYGAGRSFIARRSAVSHNRRTASSGSLANAWHEANSKRSPLNEKKATQRRCSLRTFCFGSPSSCKHHDILPSCRSGATLRTQSSTACLAGGGGFCASVPHPETSTRCAGAPETTRLTSRCPKGFRPSSEAHSARSALLRRYVRTRAKHAASAPRCRLRALRTKLASRGGRSAARIRTTLRSFERPAFRRRALRKHRPGSNLLGERRWEGARNIYHRAPELRERAGERYHLVIVLAL